MTDSRTSKEKVDPLTERLRFLRPTAKYKFAKDQYYMVGEVMHEAAHEIERLRSLHDAYVMAAAKHAQELERQRDDARIVSDRWAAEAQRLRASNEPPADLLEASQRVSAIALGAAGKHAERVVELEAEVSTLREHLAEQNRLLSLNVAELERLRAAQPPLIEPAAEQSAANSGQSVSRETAQSGTTAGSSLPPPADDPPSPEYVRLLNAALYFVPRDRQIHKEIVALVNRPSPTKSGEQS